MPRGIAGGVDDPIVPRRSYCELLPQQVWPFLQPDAASNIPHHPLTIDHLTIDHLTIDHLTIPFTISPLPFTIT